MVREYGTEGLLMLGSPVFTHDGGELGNVKEIRGRFFKINAPGAADYWLTTGCVAAAAADQVIVGVDKDALGDFKTALPDSAPSRAG